MEGNRVASSTVKKIQVPFKRKEHNTRHFFLKTKTKNKQINNTLMSLGLTIQPTRQ